MSIAGSFEEAAFKAQVRQLANRHPNYGYRRITAFLRRGVVGLLESDALRD